MSWLLNRDTDLELLESIAGKSVIFLASFAKVFSGDGVSSEISVLVLMSPDLVSFT